MLTSAEDGQQAATLLPQACWTGMATVVIVSWCEYEGVEGAIAYGWGRSGS